MDFIKKNKTDAVISLLLLESLALSFVLTNKLFFWTLLLVILATVAFLGSISLEIDYKTYKKFWSSKNRSDILYIGLFVLVLNTNLSVISNRFFIIVLLLLSFLGLRYFLHIILHGAANQIQKNAITLAGVLIIFLGSNLLTNLFLISEKNGNTIFLPGTSVVLYILIFFVSYYNMIKAQIARKWVKIYSLSLALIMTEAFVLASYFVEKYPNIYKGSAVGKLNIATTSLYLVVIYYCLYGIMIHKFENRLTFKIILEYVSVSIIIFATLLLTIKWFPK